MSKGELHQLSATEAARQIAAGTLRSEDLVRACLDRIEAREPEIAAWQHVDPQVALSQARERDGERPRRGTVGILHGIPVGFKDITDTADMPTTYGSAIYQGHRPIRDAACVMLSRLAGAVIMGKTVTTEFAARYPGRTANPLDRMRTPGGSSSGSAAAVAAGMVPLATGTQTLGSTIRPAAYCGIYGYKPTFGLLSLAGIKPLCESFDTLGLFGRSIDDLELFRAALLGIAKPKPGASLQPKRIGFCRTPLWNEADTATQQLIEEAVGSLAKAGVQVTEISLPSELAKAEDIIWSIVHFAMARNFAEEYEHNRDGLSSWALAKIEAGRNLPLETYLGCLAQVDRLRSLAREQLTDVDAILAPSAPGEAPKGLSNTGPPGFQAIWHLLQMPAIALPTFTGPDGMPIGVQLLGHVREDDQLFRIARAVERLLA